MGTREHGRNVRDWLESQEMRREQKGDTLSRIALLTIAVHLDVLIEVLLKMIEQSGG